MGKVVVYAGTRNLYPHMVVALKSLLYNTPSIDRVYFLIEDDVFSTPLPPVVRTINVRRQEYFSTNGPNYASEWTYMALMRTALTKLLPEEKQVLYLDVDTIVDRDISELFSLDMRDYCYAGVKEPWKSKDVFIYVNDGVLLINLDLIRKLGRDDEMIAYINRFKLSFPDQETINLLFQTRIRTISGEFNCTPYTDSAVIPRIMHYATLKKWDNEYLYQKYEAVTWKEILKCDATNA